MDRRSRSSVGSGAPGGGRRRNLEEVAERLLHGRGNGGPRPSAGSGAPQFGPARARRSANNASNAAAAGVAGSAAGSSRVTSPPDSRGRRADSPSPFAAPRASAPATPPGNDSGGASGRATPLGGDARSEHCQTPNMSEQVPVGIHRSRLRDGGAALLSSGPSHSYSTPVRLQRVPRGGANASAVSSAAASSGTAAREPGTFRRSFGEEDWTSFDTGRLSFGEDHHDLDEEYRRTFTDDDFWPEEDAGRETFSGATSLATFSRGSARESDDAEEDMSMLEEELLSSHERDRERELRARVRGLQRQLEGLQLATATLQAVVNQTSAQAESAQNDFFASRGVGSPARAALDAPSEVISLQEARASRQGGASGPRFRPLRGRAGAPIAAPQHPDAMHADENEDTEFHAHVTCDGCGMGPPLLGEVMKCMDCPDFDFCAHCYRDRERLGHPRGHRFVPRMSSMPAGPGMAMSGAGALGPMLAQGRGRMAGVLLRLLETEMLHEALRQSTEGDGAQEETPEDKELRSAEVLSMLPRINWYHPSEKEGRPTHNCEECALCLEEYVKGEEVLKLPCRHLFHEGCLGPWFTKSLTCPLCKQEVTPTTTV